jgi:hypothetical protein
MYTFPALVDYETLSRSSASLLAPNPMIYTFAILKSHHLPLLLLDVPGRPDRTSTLPWRELWSVRPEIGVVAASLVYTWLPQKPSSFILPTIKPGH